MSFLDEGQGALNFEIPKDIESQLPKLGALKPGDKSSAKMPCKNWKLNDVRAGWNRDESQLCVNIVATGLDPKYNNTGETENWLRAEYVDQKGHVQRAIASSYANLMIGVGASSPNDWKGVESGRDILNTLASVASAQQVQGFFDANLVITRRAYENRDGQTVPVEEFGFQYIDNGRKEK
jgi:hypothetical protein